VLGGAVVEVQRQVASTATLDVDSTVRAESYSDTSTTVTITTQVCLSFFHFSLSLPLSYKLCEIDANNGRDVTGKLTEMSQHFRSTKLTDGRTSRRTFYHTVSCPVWGDCIGTDDGTSLGFRQSFLLGLRIGVARGVQWPRPPFSRKQKCFRLFVCIVPLPPVLT